MNQREINLLCLKDILEHLLTSQEQLQWANNPETIGLLTQSMLRDVERCQRILAGLHRRAQAGSATR